MEKIQVRRINFLPNLIKNTKQTKNKKTKNKLNKTKFTLINDTSFYCYLKNYLKIYLLMVLINQICYCVV